MSLLSLRFMETPTMTFAKNLVKGLTPAGRKMLDFLQQHNVPVADPLVERYLSADKKIDDVQLLVAVLMAHYHTFANGNTTLVHSALCGVTQMAGYNCHRALTPQALLLALVPLLSAYLTKQRPMPIKQLRNEAGDIASTLYVAEMAIAHCRSESVGLFSLENLFDSCL